MKKCLNLCNKFILIIFGHHYHTATLQYICLQITHCAIKVAPYFPAHIYS
uniref:Uncharacterized protein n=1 Tax=Anguilla anguilla TaxID=7936 RepID=A0A0E9WW78_ANGAN